MTSFVKFDLLPADAVTVCPALVLIRSRVADNQGLRAHEMVHVGQMRRDGWLRFLWRYAFSRSWRQRYEVEAYVVSVEHGGDVATFARLLAEDYGLKITEADAVRLLTVRG